MHHRRKSRPLAMMFGWLFSPTTTFSNDEAIGGIPSAIAALGTLLFMVAPAAGSNYLSSVKSWSTSLFNTFNSSQESIVVVKTK
jgi:hypothetical protein